MSLRKESTSGAKRATFSTLLITADSTSLATIMQAMGKLSAENKINLRYVRFGPSYYSHLRAHYNKDSD